MGVKISELTTATSANSNDVLPIVQGGETKQISKENFIKELKPTAWTNVTLESELSGGTIRYTKIGNIVIVTIRNLTTSTALTGGTVLAQGLPSSIVGENFLMSNYTSTNNDLNCLIGMSTTGVLSIIGDTMYAGNAQYFGQFVYLTNE